MTKEVTQTPSDIGQIPIVWKYELLRHLRSWRLAASVMVVAVILALMFALPPMLGQPYSGTDENVALEVTSATGYSQEMPYGSVAMMSKKDATISNVIVYVDGVEYPQDEWQMVAVGDIPSAAAVPELADGYVLLFDSDLSGNAVTVTYDWRITPENLEATALMGITWLVVICATFFASDSVVGEFSNRTAYLLFPNPVKRSVMFLGKYASSATAGAMVLSLMYAATAVMSFAVAGGLDDGLWLSYLFAIEFLLAATAIGFLLSSLLKGTTGSIVLTFFLLGMILPIVDTVSSVSSTEFAGSLTYSAGVILNILHTPYPVDTTVDMGGLEYSQFFPDPAVSAVVMLAWTVAALAIGLVLFKRKQLLG